MSETAATTTTATTSVTADDITPETNTVPARVLPFALFLQDHRQGALHTELSEGLRELSARCTEMDKPGELILRVRLEPKSDGLMIVTDDVVLKPPKGVRPSAFYFADGDHNLTRDNPQLALPLDGLREVPRPPEARDPFAPGA